VDGQKYLFSSGLEARVDSASRRFKFTIQVQSLPEDTSKFLEDPQRERSAHYRDMGIAASKHSHAERETVAKTLTAHMPLIIDVEYCGA